MYTASDKISDMRIILYARFIVVLCSLSAFTLIHYQQSSVFNSKEVTPQLIYEINKFRKYSESIPDNIVKLMSNCTYKFHREYVFRSLKWWVEFAKNHNIIWWLESGTALGAFRHGDLIPYDSDLDIGFITNERVKHVLRTAAEKYPLSFLEENRTRIVHRYSDLHCRYNDYRYRHPRKSCKGITLYKHIDLCTFCGPTARIMHDNWKKLNYIDLYAAYLPKAGGFSRYYIYNEEYDEEGFHPLFETQWLFPLRLCRLMGLEMPCPQDPHKYFGRDYPNWTQPSHKCYNGKWVKLITR